MLPVPLFSGKIVHFYSDEALTLPYCQKTFDTVNALKDKYSIQSVCTPVSSVYSYWQALKQVWGQSDLIIIEQDIGFTKKQLLQLIRCEQKDCTFAYKLHPITTLLPEDVWSIGENHLPYRIRLYTLCETLPEFCNFSALGFIKLSLETQNKLPLDVPVHFDFMDIGIIGKIPDLKLHVHSEVEHIH